MKKIHIHTDYWFFAGCENMVAVLLDKSKFNDEFKFSLSFRFTDDYVAGLGSRMTDIDIPLYPLKLLPAKRFLNRIEKIFFLLVKPVLIIWDIVLLYRVFRRENPEIVYINNGGYPGARSCRSAVLAAKVAGIENVIFYVNNIAVSYKSIIRYLDLPIDYLVKKNVTYFVTASRYAGFKLCQILGLESNQVLHICNTFQSKDIDKSRQEVRKRLGIYDSQVVIGSVGLLEKRKGHKYLIEAVRLIKNKLNNQRFKVVIVGFGLEEKSLVKLISRHGLSEYVKIIPNQDNIFNYYNSFDVFVLASVKNDDFPFTVREAMYMGLPIVSTRFAGIPEIVENNSNGFLVKAKDFGELAGALSRLVQDPELRHRFGLKSKDIYNRKLSQSQIIKSYKDLFNRIGEK